MGQKSIDVTGLGQYIAANDGVKDKFALGTLAMCFVVGLCIAFVWQPLYRATKTKISLLIAGRLNSTKFLR